MSTTLEDFDDDFPTATAPAGRAGKLEDLPDGEYLFEITRCEVKGDDETRGNGPLVTLKLQVLTDGPQFEANVEHTYWLTKKDDAGQRVKNERDVGQLKKDLETLGFDVKEWTKEHARPFSAELLKAAKAMRGVAFHGKKKTNTGNQGKKFHNLYVNSRSDQDGKPGTFGPAELAAAAAADADPFAVD